MDFRLTDDQRLLADGVREFLSGECTADHVRAAWDAGHHDDRRWKALAGLGVVGATVPESHGGMGLTTVDLAHLLVEAGRAALPEPLLETTAVSAPLLAEVGGELADTWLPRIASGDAIVVTVLPDVDPYPAHAGSADLLLVADGHDLFAVAPDQVGVTAQPNVDGARPTASVGAPRGTSAATGVGSALRRAADRGAVAAAAMLVGTGEAMIDLAVDYAGQREQFGQPIGTFQAVKHHLADALVDVRFARPLVERAADSIDRDLPDASAHAAMAKAFASDAADAAARHALQVHGAIGYTWECDLHLWMKRSWSLAAAFGDVESCWQAVETHLLA